MPESEAVELSVIIVTWNNAKEILGCLGALHEPHGDVLLEVFVVDNGSQDPTATLVARHYPGVRLLVNEQNLGFAAANNQALKLASGRSILLLNPDTIVQPGALRTMIDHLENHPSVGAVGPRLVRVNGTVQRSCLRPPSVTAIVWGYLSGGTYLPRSRSAPTPVQAVSGAALMIRRDVFEQIGLLDSDYYMYGEDNDWCYRIRRAGWEIHYLPTAQIVHLGGQSARLVPVQTYVRRRLAQLIFVRKHRKSWEYHPLVHLMRLNLQLRWLGARGTMRHYYHQVRQVFEHEVSALEKRLHPLERS